MRRALGLATGIAAILALSGCVRLGGKPPREFLVLSPAEPLAPGTERTAASPGAIITVIVPNAAPPVSGVRVPVYQGPIAIAYVKDAVLADTAARQFARILIETISARTGRLALDLRQSSIVGGLKLQGTLQRFGVDEASGRAVIAYDAVVTRADGSIISRRFEARSQSTAIEARPVGAALNSIAGDVATQVADWVKAL